MWVKLIAVLKDHKLWLTGFNCRSNLAMAGLRTYLGHNVRAIG